MSGTVALACFFAPKVYIVLWQPYKNVRNRQSAVGKLVNQQMRFIRFVLKFLTTPLGSSPTWLRIIWMTPLFLTIFSNILNFIHLLKIFQPPRNVLSFTFLNFFSQLTTQPPPTLPPDYTTNCTTSVVDLASTTITNACKFKLGMHKWQNGNPCHR